MRQLCKPIFLGILLAATAAGAPSVAIAQSNGNTGVAATTRTIALRPVAGSSEASISVGSSSIAGPDGNLHPNYGVSYGYNWSGNFALLAEYSGQALAITSTAPATPTAASTASTCLASGSSCASTTLNGRSLQRYGMAFRYSFKRPNRGRQSTGTPYLIAAIGSYRASTALASTVVNTTQTCCIISGTPTTSTIATTSYSTGTAFGAYESIGGGVTIYVNRNWGIRPEARLIHMMQSSSTASSIFTATTLSTGSSSTNVGIGGLAETGAQSSNNDFSAAVSIFHQWGGSKTKP